MISKYKRRKLMYRKKNKELLIVFPNTVVDPGAVVIHLADAALAHRAVVGTLRLDAAALGALKDHLALPKAHALDILPCGVALGNCPL